MPVVFTCVQGVFAITVEQVLPLIIGIPPRFIMYRLYFVWQLFIWLFAMVFIINFWRIFR